MYWLSGGLVAKKPLNGDVFLPEEKKRGRVSPRFITALVGGLQDD